MGAGCHRQLEGCQTRQRRQWHMGTHMQQIYRPTFGFAITAFCMLCGFFMAGHFNRMTGYTLGWTCGTTIWVWNAKNRIRHVVDSTQLKAVGRWQYAVAGTLILISFGLGLVIVTSAQERDNPLTGVAILFAYSCFLSGCSFASIGWVLRR